jgi:glycosyltransferase involved in cell wall biosynthesis
MDYAISVIGWDRTASLPRIRTREFGKLELLPIRASFGRGLENFPQLLRWQLGLLRWLIRNRRSIDVIHACDFDTILPSLVVGKLFRKKIVYDIFDFYADHLRNTPNWIKRIIRLVDLWAIGRADTVILVDESRRIQIREAKPKRVTIIYNSPEDILSAHRKSGRQRERDRVLHTSNRDVGELKISFQIAYIGLMNIERGLLDLLDVMGREPTWRLDLAGFGGDESIIRSRSNDLPNVRHHGPVAYERAIELMGTADALVALYDPSIPNHRFASPNKLFEAMMLAKPIVVACSTNIDRIVEQEGCGLVVSYGDQQALEKALSSLANDTDMCGRLGAAGRKAYTQKYHWDFMRNRLINLYKEFENS